MTRIDMFIIDGQNDFCDPKGALYVTGAEAETEKVKQMIKRLRKPGGHRIHKLNATLDSHHRNDGSHNISWKKPNGQSPDPFTIVTRQLVKDQQVVPRFPIAVWEGKVIPSYEWALKYSEALELRGRCPLCLWPVHCEIGKWGQNVHPALAEAYDDWTDATGTWINYISKGQWPFTEHYSGLVADVPDPTRPETQMNIEVIQDAMQADMIVWAGWAGSHCLKWTALDAINFFGNGNNEFIKKCVFLEDASAAVPNPPGGPDFAQWRKDFLSEVAQRGATVTTTEKFLA